MAGSVLFGAIFAGMGLVFIASGIHDRRRTDEFLTRARRVPGIVVRMQPRTSATDTVVYYPVLRFRTLDGAEVETTAETRGDPMSLSKLRGHQVPVLYDPSRPERARMDTGSGRGRANGVGLAFAGVVFAAIGAALLVSGLP